MYICIYLLKYSQLQGILFLEISDMLGRTRSEEHDRLCKKRSAMGSKFERPHEFLQSYQSGHSVHQVLFFGRRPILNIVIHRSVFWAARVSANQLLLLNGSSCI